MQAEVISIGTELTTGAILDTNSAWLSSRLAESGVSVVRHITLRDEILEVQDAITAATGRSELLLITGGLGPTPDDITRDALALAAGADLIQDPVSLERIGAIYRKLGKSMPESNMIQAMIPKGAKALDNPYGTAPGIQMTINRAEVFVMPGVPREMKPMYERFVVAWIQSHQKDQAIALRALRTFGIGESNLAEQLGELLAPGRNPAIGTTASEGVITVRVLAKANSQERADRLADEDAAAVRSILGPLVFGEDDATLASVLGALMTERGETISTAESCTGGLLGAMLTDVSGSSAYFVGGFVTYSNEMKARSIGVSEALIAKRGAVSGAVAEAMAAGCREKTGSDYALSITGVAGPTGGTPDKPVGLVYIGLADGDGVRSKRKTFGDHLNRAAVRDRAAKFALNWLRLKLIGVD